jgi:regulatory protein
MTVGRHGRTRDREPPGPEEALEIATRFMGVRPRSEWEVEQRLARAHASPEVIASTLDRLHELALVDDLAFARWWLEQRDRHAPRGRRLIEAELRRQRVSRGAIEQLRDEIAAAESRDADHHADASAPRTDQERAELALQQHLRGRPLPADPRALQRIGMFLVRRGFDPDTVRLAIRSSGTEPPSPDE